MNFFSTNLNPVLCKMNATEISSSNEAGGYIQLAVLLFVIFVITFVCVVVRTRGEAPCCTNVDETSKV